MKSTNNKIIIQYIYIYIYIYLHAIYIHIKYKNVAMTDFNFN